ncbi:MAG: BsaWI family type II restriction enzyme [Clostridium sp.]|nr:BsaWI family type II restriction enzyme [Clostridium sp.]
MNEDLMYKYCVAKYNEIYSATKRSLSDAALKRSGKDNISDSIAKKIETDSQLEAIKQTMIEGRLKYPSSISELWNNIYKAHLYRKSGVSDPAVVANVIAAAQSWKSSSGHAFEYMSKELANLSLSGTAIKFLLQKDLNAIIKADGLANEVRDIAWLEKQIRTDNFDLYSAAEIDGKTYCFGCIQCKTSIRDRVSRDREISMNAMQAYFWSISLVLDGSMLVTPKYKSMVNGGSVTFRENGWHGMYDLSHTTPGNRLYNLDMDFRIIKDHALQAFHAWSAQRQWFTHEWIAK